MEKRGVSQAIFGSTEKWLKIGVGLKRFIQEREREGAETFQNVRDDRDNSP